MDISLTPKALAGFYTRHFRYYLSLEERGKQRFILRCLSFIREKEIIGAGGFVADNRVKALVAASAVQLTLGLEVWQLSHFETIVIHPSDFDNASGELKYSGETNLRGYIRFSWKRFLSGYRIPDDNLNLGLHEFSHALWFNNARRQGQDHFIEQYVQKWKACAYEAFSDTRQNKPTIFRAYGGTNIEEFMSVCIEHYFESPGEIREQYPTLYYATGILLNQEPSADHTRLGVRERFFTEQAGVLPGFADTVLQSRFIYHWSFRLMICVLLLLGYSSVTGGIWQLRHLGLIAAALLLLSWYRYRALRLVFRGKEVIFESPSFLFRKTQQQRAPVSRLISLKAGRNTWRFIYYHHDASFRRVEVHPAKGGKSSFLTRCSQNKIPLIRPALFVFMLQLFNLVS